MTATLKTREVAGHAITLEAGRDYYASRPMARYRHVHHCDVSITEEKSGKVVRIIKNVTFNEADAFLREFNSDWTMARGRTW